MAKFQIMTFDGGGIRGALVAAILQHLEKKFPQLLTNVDLFAGTSTGSSIALSLAHGRSTSALNSLYSTERMKFVFGKSRWNFLWPKHSNKNLKKLLEENFPDVQEGSGSRKLVLADLKKKVLVTSFKVNDEKTKNWSPVFFHNYPSGDTCEPSSDQPVVDVALRSAAAPTIFPSHQGYIDGGMMANNPSTAAIAIALRHNPGLHIEDIRLLSFGTGFSPTLIKAKTHNWGVLQWLLNPFSEPKEPLLSILFDGVVEADHFMSREILGEENYLRLNLKLPNQTACDDWRQVPNMVELADKAFERYNQSSPEKSWKDGTIKSTLNWLEKNWFDEPVQASAAVGK